MLLVGLHHESIFGVFIFLPSCDSSSKLFHTLQANSHLIFVSLRILSHRIAWLAPDIINCLGTNWIPQRMLPVCCVHALISIPLNSAMGRWISTTLAIYSMRHVWCQPDYAVHSFIYHSYYIPDVFYTTCTVYHLQCNKIFLFGTFIWDARNLASCFTPLHDVFKKKKLIFLFFFPFLPKTPLQQDTNMRI